MNQDINKSEYKEININIRDYLRTIVKRKRLIFGIFIVGIIFALGVYFLLPSKYEIETTLEIGTFNGVLLEPSIQLAEKIKSGFYGSCPGIEAKNILNTNLIQIKVVSENSEEAKKTLENINNAVIAEHNNNINNNNNIDFQKKVLDNKIAIIEELIESMKKNINFLIARNQQIAAIEIEISGFQIQLDNLKSQKENYQLTRVIQQPTVSEKKLNLILSLIIGGVLGIFVGVFLVFTKEWWEKANKIFNF